MVDGGPLRPILKPADFSLILRRPSTSRSPHFALHYLSGVPTLSSQAAKRRAAGTLSTATAPGVDRPVDILCSHGGRQGVDAIEPSVALTRAGDVVGDANSADKRVWIGLVVPKRHAKRSVTRTLMKRQIRVAFEDARDRLQPGMWVVRLRAPFGKADYPSAASDALKQVVRCELTSLVAQGVRQRERTS